MQTTSFETVSIKMRMVQQLVFTTQRYSLVLKDQHDFKSLSFDTFLTTG